MPSFFSSVALDTFLVGPTGESGEGAFLQHLASVRSSCMRHVPLRSGTPPRRGGPRVAHPCPPGEALGRRGGRGSAERTRQDSVAPGALSPVSSRRETRPPGTGPVLTGFRVPWETDPSGGKKPPVPGSRWSSRVTSSREMRRVAVGAAGPGLKGPGCVSTERDPRERFSPQRPTGRHPQANGATSPWGPEQARPQGKHQAPPAAIRLRYRSVHTRAAGPRCRQHLPGANALVPGY